MLPGRAEGPDLRADSSRPNGLLLLAGCLQRTAPMPRKRIPKNEALTMYEFETVLPAQFYTNQRRLCALQPEKRLMLAVMEDAVTTVLRGMSGASETQAWFEEDDFTWPYSFANLCDALSLDRHAVRVGLRRQRERRRLAA